MRTPLIAISMLFSFAASATDRMDTPIARDVLERLKDLDVETSTPSRELRARTYLRSEVGVRHPSRVSAWSDLHGDEREVLAVREAIDEEVQRLVRDLWRRGPARAELTDHARAELGHALDILFGGGDSDSDGVRDAFAHHLHDVAREYPAPASREAALAYVARVADALERTVKHAVRIREAGRGALTDDVSRDLARRSVKLITEAYLVSAVSEPDRGPRARTRALLDRVRRIYRPTIVSRFWDEVRSLQLRDRPLYDTGDFEPYDDVAEIGAHQIGVLRSVVHPRTLAETCAELLVR